MVGAQAIIGDVVAPRDRGRYQGLFGAVFGVTTVIGPLAGGLLTEHLSWRWVFYVNLPFGVIALLVTAAVLPGVTKRVHHVIDYLGTVLLAGSATAFVLLTSTGGTTYAWGSTQIKVMGVVGVVALVAWIFVERRAAEPLLPLHLFKLRTFSVTSAVGFVIGFAMFGAIVFLPLFLQDVRGVSPTMSGLQILPLMGGLLITSIGSGQIISRWGRYRIFPIFGCGVTTIGLFLLHLVTLSTSTFVFSVYMFVLGSGLGAVMQVLVLAVQNAVPHEELGVATSGATFFRSMGGSFGTAIFGAIFANVITGKLHHDLAGIKLPAGLNSTSVSPEVLAKLPEAIRHGYELAFSSSLGIVFLVAVPIGFVAFLLSLLIPEGRLRRAGEGVNPAADAGEGDEVIPQTPLAH
jgi:MFS family permease